MDLEDNDVTWPLGKSVLRGEIDNTERGRITGKIWLKGREEPLELDLKGNCMRDIAGCRIAFSNREPSDEDDVDLACLQTGLAGEITASRKIRYFGPSDDLNFGKTGNCIYLEWFSDVNGRVLLEGPDFSIEIQESKWFMSPEDEKVQIESVAGILARWAREMSDFESIDSEPRRMDEFEWERNLRESDALTDRFSKVLEKYIDHPNCDRLIAREMGWTWLLDAEEEKALAESTVMSDDTQDMDDYDEDDFDFQPNPLTEGIDWVKGENGRISHPLAHKAFNMAIDLWSYCKSAGYLDEGAHQDIRDMIFQAQALSAKLAGALDSLAYDCEPDGGFVVACLKRALPHINSALSCSDNAGRRRLFPEKKLAYFRSKMLEIREETIRLMARYRKNA